jgi:hypothetical protein
MVEGRWRGVLSARPAGPLLQLAEGALWTK